VKYLLPSINSYVLYFLEILEDQRRVVSLQKFKSDPGGCWLVTFAAIWQHFLPFDFFFDPLLFLRNDLLLLDVVSWAFPDLVILLLICVSALPLNPANEFVCVVDLAQADDFAWLVAPFHISFEQIPLLLLLALANHDWCFSLLKHFAPFKIFVEAFYQFSKHLSFFIIFMSEHSPFIDPLRTVILNFDQKLIFWA